jgi:tRNA(Arg) A34 adenosine deaminase TadA
MQDKIKYMKLALELASENLKLQNGGPFGALVVKDGKIIGKGNNQVVSHKDPTAHAEIIAIRQACEYLNDHQLEGCEIYTSCEPCPMCLGAIYWARPKKIYFAASRHDAEKAGFDDSHIYRELELPTIERSIPTEQILHKEAAEIFEKWSSLIEKPQY